MNEGQTSATEMHDVVEMLLTRIKDYPEDFVTAPSDYSFDMKETKWKRALRNIESVLNPTEKEVINKALSEAQRAVYMGAALKTMLGDESVEEETLTIQAKNRYTFSNSGAVGLGTTSATTAPNIQLGKAVLTEDKVNLITELQAKQKNLEERMKQNLMNTGLFK